MTFLGYWLDQIAPGLWVGYGFGWWGTWLEWPVTCTDLTSLPTTAKIYVKGRRTR